MTLSIETVHIDSLRPAPWAVSHLLRPDERLLLQSLAVLCQGVYLADLIAILASIDPVLGDVDR